MIVHQQHRLLAHEAISDPNLRRTISATLQSIFEPLLLALQGKGHTSLAEFFSFFRSVRMFLASAEASNSSVITANISLLQAFWPVTAQVDGVLSAPKRVPSDALATCRVLLSRFRRSLLLCEWGRCSRRSLFCLAGRNSWGLLIVKHSTYP